MQYISIKDISVEGETVTFRYSKAPRSIEDTTLINGWHVVSRACPEIDTTNNIIFTFGSYLDRDDTLMYCPLSKWGALQKAFAAWNMDICGHVSKKMYIICPECRDISNSILKRSQIDAFVGYANCTDCSNGLGEKEVHFDPLYTVYKIYEAHFTSKNKNNQEYYEFLSTLTRKHKLFTFCTRCGTESGETSLYPNFVVDHGCSNCIPHFDTCTRCERLVPTAILLATAHGKLCPRHITNGICDCCETKTKCMSITVRIPNNYHGENTDTTICNTCINVPPESYLDKEYSYSYKNTNIEAIDIIKNKVQIVDLSVIPKKNAGIKASPFMGMEIELVMGANSPKALASGNPNWYPSVNKGIKKINDALTSVFNKVISLCKHDGTIPEGTEVVTNPLSFAAWKKLYHSGALKELFAFNDASATNRSVIGGHIHLNKASVSKKQLYSMSKFMHEHTSFMTEIAGRPFSKDARWYSAKLAMSPINMVRVGNYITPERYVALNVTKHTIEHRYFATPMCPEDVMRNVEFVHALWSGTRFGYLDSVDKFRAHVEKEYKQYPFLANWFDNKKGVKYVKNALETPVSGPRTFEDLLRTYSRPVPDATATPIYNTCSSCGNSNSSVRYCVDTEEYMCMDCGWITCENCYDTVASWDNITNLGNVCLSCNESNQYRTCPSCNDRVTEDSCIDVRISSQSTESASWCTVCTENEARWCAECNTFFANGVSCACPDIVMETIADAITGCSCVVCTQARRR